MFKSWQKAFGILCTKFTFPSNIFDNLFSYHLYFNLNYVYRFCERYCKDIEIYEYNHV